MQWSKLFAQLPLLIGETLRIKRDAWSDSAKLRQQTLSLQWNEASARTVISELEQLLSRDHLERVEKHIWSDADLSLAEEIAAETAKAGMSNITRTASYLKCFQRFPELHWAFLAHMVSRNAGWNMTDLHGTLIQDFISKEDKPVYYRFLERSNALIFQDAYPQLLLYMKSRERGISHFHLLPYFHVSRFMKPFWERFWIDRNSALLTVALIINEQNYIEQRVITNSYYQKKVSNKAKFHLFSVGGFNQTLFPMMNPSSAMISRFAGRTVSDFSSLQERVQLGKNLYAILMGLQDVRYEALYFAEQVPHTGSRADYAPELFTWDKEKADATANLPANLDTKLHSTKYKKETLPAGQRFYSPKLLDIWHDTPYEPITKEDWFINHKMLHTISKPKLPLLCDITKEYYANMTKLTFGNSVI
jgi:hypothetical protein